MKKLDRLIAIGIGLALFGLNYLLILGTWGNLFGAKTIGVGIGFGILSFLAIPFIIVIAILGLICIGVGVFD